MALEGAPHYGLTEDELRAMPTVYRPDLFKGKVVVVTGAGSGFGFAIATLFARLGADLAILGRNEERLAKAKTFFESLGAAVYTEAFNIRDPRTLHGLYRQRLARAMLASTCSSTMPAANSRSRPSTSNPRVGPRSSTTTSMAPGI